MPDCSAPTEGTYPKQVGKSVVSALNEAISVRKSHPKSMMVIDADGTLADVDTGQMFWRLVTGRGQ